MQKVHQSGIKYKAEKLLTKAREIWTIEKLLHTLYSVIWLFILLKLIKHLFILINKCAHTNTIFLT